MLQLKKSTPYMLRNDGELLECGDMHPYIKYIIQEPNDKQIIDLFTLYPEFLYWFYCNTNHKSIKEDINNFVSIVMNNNFYNFNDSVIADLKDKYNVSDFTAKQFDLEKLFLAINDETNQEFCKVRTSALKYGGSDRSIYFRIGSTDFNWFNIIWDVVYRYKDLIDFVNICTDTQSTGRPIKWYNHNGKFMQNIPTSEFITLSGNPIFERNYTDLVKCKLYEGLSLRESFGEVHPGHIHNIFNTMQSVYEDRFFM